MRRESSRNPLESLSHGCVPSMGRDLEVKVLWISRSQRIRAKRKAESRKASSREAGAERSVERNRESTNRNRIRGGADQGERALNREALATTKGGSVDPATARGRSRTLTWGDLA